MYVFLQMFLIDNTVGIKVLLIYQVSVIYSNRLLGLVCLFKLKAYVASPWALSPFRLTKEGGRECCPTPPLYILCLCYHNICWLFEYLNETIVLSLFIIL